MIIVLWANLSLSANGVWVRVRTGHRLADLARFGRPERHEMISDSQTISQPPLSYRTASEWFWPIKFNFHHFKISPFFETPNDEGPPDWTQSPQQKLFLGSRSLDTLRTLLASSTGTNWHRLRRLKKIKKSFSSPFNFDRRCFYILGWIEAKIKFVINCSQLLENVNNLCILLIQSRPAIRFIAWERSQTAPQAERLSTQRKVG